MADIDKTAPGLGDVPDDAPTGALLREAIDETRTLMKLEVALAKQEVKEDLNDIKMSGIALGAAGVLGIVGLSMLALGLVLAIAATWACALLVGAAFLLLAVVAAYVGYSKLPRKPLERTKKRLETDLQQLNEHVA
jgi:uncharacterized membrane protein YqjE